MNYAENPIEDLHNAMAHAEYEGFSNIHYETRDWELYKSSDRKEDKRIPKTRRPTTRDFGVYAMFPQTWGSTALGHGGMGGASMTTAYTIVLECTNTGEFLVYFGGSYCYTIKGKNDAFLEDCKNRCLAGKRKAKTKYGIVEQD